MRDIQIFNHGSERFDPIASIFIISYDLATRKADELTAKSFNACIADEAHYLKSHDSKRSLVLTPILQKCKRIVLVTGTPILHRPCELYNILKILRPDIFKNFFEYSNRYCAPKIGKYGMDYKWSSCASELHYLMAKNVMIRRLKIDVLT